VASGLLKKIFSGKLKDGEKLPTEKELSKMMEVDRTTLRVALKQLESMQLLEIRQGDGIYVKDYLKNAGVDFLSQLISLQDVEYEAMGMEEYLVDEAWGFWAFLFPEILKKAVPLISTRHISMLMELLQEEKKSLHNKDKLVELDLAQQDLVAEIINNLVLSLLFNSTRPLRRKMLEIFVYCTDSNELEMHVDNKIDMIRCFASGSIEDSHTYIETFKKLLSSYQEKVKHSLMLKKWGSADNKE
jgi:GntR family transcriptional repressor for pyruvate dehydrogenase complex